MQESFYLKEEPMLLDDDIKASNYWKAKTDPADEAKFHGELGQKVGVGYGNKQKYSDIHSVQIEIISTVDLTHSRLNNF